MPINGCFGIFFIHIIIQILIMGNIFFKVTEIKYLNSKLNVVFIFYCIKLFYFMRIIIFVLIIQCWFSLYSILNNITH